MTEFPHKPCSCPDRRTAGMEVRGVYDGILYWFCLDCGSRWHRWPADSYLHDRAEPYVEGTVGGGGAGDRA